MSKKLVSTLTCLAIVFVVLNLQACDAVQQMIRGTPTPTSTSTSTKPPATNTPSPTPTKTPTPTWTPSPTRTQTPTPAPIGSTVSYKTLEITVIDVINRESVHFGLVMYGSETFYKPSAGHFLIDVGVLVRNMDPDNVVPVSWSNIYVIEETGDAWYPIWGSALTVEEGVEKDPFTIGLSQVNIEGYNVVEFENDTYLRLIYGVRNNPNQVILFGIKDSPKISFTLME